jgi:hypothetical protein
VRRSLVLAAVALLSAAPAACGPVQIKLAYRARPPTAERSGRVAFGTFTDERSNRREVATDVTLASDSPTMPAAVETLLREGLVWAGYQIVDTARLRMDARLHTAWARQTFYNVQATIQVTVSLVDASGTVVWTHRFGVVEAAGSADARTNHQDAFSKALSKLAADVADAFASSTFAEATVNRALPAADLTQ